MAGLDTPQLIFFVILGAAFLLLLTERLRNDVVALLIVLALSVSGLLKPDKALSGFGSEPAIVVAAIFVLSAALHRTGVSDALGRAVARLAGTGLARALAVIMPSVALLSAFTHHLTTTAIMLPVTLDLARSRKIPASRLLMPMSFAASLGTTITIIGAPAFLIASQALREAGRPGLGIFSIAPIGLALSAAGTIFILLVGRWLLPERKGADTATDPFRLDEYFTELTVLDDSPFRGKTVREVGRDGPYRVKVVGLVRDGRRAQRPLGDRRVEPGDVLVLQGDDEALERVANDPGILMLVPFHAERSPRRKGPLAAAIMLATVLLAAFDVLSIEMAGLAGAVAMVLTGCLTASQAYRAIDARIYVFIAGAIPLGAAMKSSGAADTLAGWLQGAVADWSETAVLLALFAVVAVVTQFMSDSATTALFAPVAVALADVLGHAPEPYVVTVAMASVVAFLTPIGHHGNLLVYGPGGYRFGDFVRVGAPLTLVSAAVVVMLAPILWPA